MCPPSFSCRFIRSVHQQKRRFFKTRNVWFSLHQWREWFKFLWNHNYVKLVVQSTTHSSFDLRTVVGSDGFEVCFSIWRNFPNDFFIRKLVWPSPQKTCLLKSWFTPYLSLVCVSMMLFRVVHYNVQWGGTVRDCSPWLTYLVSHLAPASAICSQVSVPGSKGFAFLVERNIGRSKLCMFSSWVSLELQHLGAVRFKKWSDEKASHLAMAQK